MRSVWLCSRNDAIGNVAVMIAAASVFATETGCEHFDAAAAAGISHSYWHYSSYCTSGPSFGNRSVPDATFGACILGWGGGDSSKCAKAQTQQQ